jgi:hypothetical protein
MNVACTKPYNADFDKLLCRKQEAWKACNLLVNNLWKRLRQTSKHEVWCNLFQRLFAKHLAAGNPLEP